MAKKKMQNIRRCATFGEKRAERECDNWLWPFVHSKRFNPCIDIEISHETVLSKFPSIIFGRFFLFRWNIFLLLLQFKFSFISIWIQKSENSKEATNSIIKSPNKISMDQLTFESLEWNTKIKGRRRMKRNFQLQNVENKLGRIGNMREELRNCLWFLNA